MGASRFKRIFVIALFVSILTGCNKEVSPIENMFMVGIDDIENVKVSQPFEIHGYLKNTTNHNVEIAFGAGLFTYQIFDEKGNEISDNDQLLVLNDIGYDKRLSAGEIYRNNGKQQRSNEFYEITIKKPGHYKVKAVAEFNIKEAGGENTDQKITSEMYDFTVK